MPFCQLQYVQYAYYGLTFVFLCVPAEKFLTLLFVTLRAILLIDTSNTFNSLARQTALLNIQELCPPFSIPLINTYQNLIELFVDGEYIFSTTQGDPMGMPMYALGVLPLIRSLESSSISQIQ